MSRLPALLAAAALLGGAPAQETAPVVVASKTFTESRLLAEIVAQLLEERAGLEVERRLGLGGSLICYAALRSGAIDAYPEYTGTAWSIILEEGEPVRDPLRCYLEVARRYRSELGLEWLSPFGLDNTYAIAVPEELAAARDLRRVSDLAARGAELRAGFSLEFMNRPDGWPGLRDAYGLDFAELRAMEHGLAYEAVASGAIDLIDAYATDGKLLRFDLRILDDDRGFFPPYHAAPVFRQETLARHPQIREALAPLAFRLDDRRIQRMNFEVEDGGRSVVEVARAFLTEEGLIEGGSAETAAAPRRTRRSERSFFQVMRARLPVTLRLCVDHLWLTGIAVLLAALVAIPMGIWATRSTLVQRLALGAAGVVQTIPSLALLAFLIPVPGFGLGIRSAIAALFLYALLPILRNTYTGIVGVDRDLVHAARGIGLTERQLLLRVQLPLASRTILAGLRTSAVVAVGVATLAAFIGAGGLGEPIVTGLQLNDANLILTGALPAAGLALLVDGALGLVERRLTPRGAG
jgi:osmoprotectant transport system permease protein